MNDAKRAVSDFGLSAIAGATLLFVGLFFVFLIRDPYLQTLLLQNKIYAMQSENDKTTGQLRNDIANLQSTVNERRDKRRIKNDLAVFSQEGMHLLARVSETPVPQSEMNDWEFRLFAYLRKNLDESYVARTLDTTNLASRPHFLVNEGPSVAIWLMTANLQKIMKEFD